MVAPDRARALAPAAVVAAAARGDRRALDTVLAGSLPLVYTIVGRALGGHSDVDDVVQETMLRMVRGLKELRQPESFRSWLVAITVRQVRNHHRARHAQAPTVGDPDTVPDPRADPVELAALRLGLSGQRHEMAEAVGWLDDDDRELLSLWWLELTGELTRAQVVASLHLSAAHVAVRIQRMKERLDQARTVARALRANPPCPELTGLMRRDDPGPLARKRLARHTRGCPGCRRSQDGQLPLEGLLAGIPLAIPPAGLAARISHAVHLSPVHLTSTSHLTSAGHGARSAGKLAAHAHRLLAVKPMVAAVSTVAVLGAGAAVVYAARSQPEPSTVVSVGAPVASRSPARSASPSPSTVVLTHPGPSAKPAAPVPSPARATKKGVSLWNFSGIGPSLTNVRAGWYYDWATTPAAAHLPSSAQFVPMIWGAKSVTPANLSQVKAESKVLLAFNEPDMGAQANLTVSQALDLWPQLMATGLRLGSPSPAFGAATPGGWLDQFMAGARARGYRVDFITLHWYGSDFSPAAVNQLRQYIVDTYQRYHKPIWVTEYALINFSDSPKYPTDGQQASFITGSTRMMNALSYVERYAWFALPATSGSGTGLYREGGTPTAAGLAYRAAG